MPIATPEKYAEMLDTAKAQGFAFPAINVSSSQTLNAALQGFADAGSDGIIQVSTGGADYLSGPNIKNMVTGSVAFAAYAVEVAKQLPRQRRTAHRPLPQEQARRASCGRSRHLRRAGEHGSSPLFQSHCGTAPPCRWRRTSRSRRAAGEVWGGRTSSSRSRWAWWAAKRTVTTGRASDGQALHHTRGRGGRLRGAAARWGGCSSPPPSATCTASTRRATSSSTPILAMVRRRCAPSTEPTPKPPFDLVFHGGSGSSLEEIGRDARLRRRQDERRHRHPVRLHPPDRRPHVRELRRRPQGRRRASATRRSTTRAAAARSAKPGWPRASSRPARTCAPAVAPSADPPTAVPSPRT